MVLIWYSGSEYPNNINDFATKHSLLYIKWNDLFCELEDNLMGFSSYKLDFKNNCLKIQWVSCRVSVNASTSMNFLSYTRS